MSLQDEMSSGGTMTTTITCLQCGGLLGPADRFCAQCGAELLWCASCGEFLLQAEQTCPRCGTPGIPRPDSHTITYELTEADSPWAEVVARLRRATLGEFEIGHELGRGGMAAVFLAHELSLHRDVAIKVMSPGLLMGDGMIERFKREAITIAHLNHPNIVSVYSVRAAEGLHFFVMRCIQGRSLEQVIREAGKLPVPIVRSILYQVGSALAYAHRFRVVHRDIKPANILLDEDGNAVVTDFGIAKAAEAPSTTHTGFMVGTPAYMSPEQCSGGEISGASDQYSLGAVAYEMVTGVPPFTGSTYSVIQAHVEQPPRPLREHHPDCPPDLEEAILRMLAKNPPERWPAMPQALSALGAVPLMEDDPLRAELSRLATGGHPPTISGEAIPAGRAPRPKNSAVLHVTPPGMLRAISILPPPPGLEVGDSFLLVARVHEGHASHLPGRPVEWSSDNPNVLRVNPTKAVATAITPGSALITAKCEGNEGRLRVTVAPPRADAIVVKSTDKPITVGDEVRLEATPRDKRGRVVTRPVTWRSENDSIATISLEGVLVARSNGSTRITAELDEARTNVPISVLPAAVAAVHISPAPETVNAGDSFGLTATPLDRWAGPLPDRTVTWNVSDVSLAVVTAAGWVMTRAPGMVLLTATCEGASASVSVNIGERVAGRISDARHPQLVAAAPAAEPEAWDLNLPSERRRPDSRRSRSRPGWLVAAGGAFLLAGGFWLVGGRRPDDGPLAPETAAATRDSTPSEDSTAKSASAPSDSGPSAVIITQRPSGPLAAGSSTNLVAEARDGAGHVMPGASVAWSSTNPLVALIDSATGTVSAIAPGRAEVVASSGARRDSVRIVVLDSGSAAPALAQSRTPRAGVSPASLSISPHSDLRAGDTATLEAVPVDRWGKRLRGARVSWSSSEPQVAEVDARSGKIRARSPGSALIIARSGTESAFSQLTVLPAAVASVRVEGARPLKVGDTLMLQADPRDQRGSGLSGRPVSWSSSDPAVAAVDSESGVVEARGPGKADISASSEGKSGQVRITVLPEPKTSRQPEELAANTAPRTADPSAENLAAERQRVIDLIRAGVDQCYGALRQKDWARLATMYNSASKSDQEKLKKLSRILWTREWDAVVGEREDGPQQVGAATAAMEFSFRLTWKDAFGGRLSSKPVFRAEFARNGSGWGMSSCRMIGSPKL